MKKISRSPLIKELDTNLPSLTLFELFRFDPFPFLLDSAMDPQKLGRYSFMGASPFLLLRSRGDSVTLVRNNEETSVKGIPFDILGHYLDEYKLEHRSTPVPFVTGAVGYFSYDLCHFIEKLPGKAIDDLRLPECYFGFYDLILAFDHFLEKAYAISAGFPEQEEGKRLKRAKERLEEFERQLERFEGSREARAAGKTPALPDSNERYKEAEYKGNFTHAGYVRAVEKARRYIIDGDIFEVNLSQRFEGELDILPYDLYLRLRKINPAPFASYLDMGEVVIASSSPERFLRLSGDRVETRPIKGTLRRGKTVAEDRANARTLLMSVKDRAENMMIVDLERNDLGRVCRFGTVKVTELAILETYPTVYHLTSTVVGRLREGLDRVDLLRATFPGGSITGAPKVRSMEIIDELEPTRRSIYTGNIGYLSFNGDLDLSIVIRTFLIKGRQAYFQVGGAVVYDSDPEAEYQETLDKGLALFKALRN
jgi:para-aminobenzoate synthetase component 1